MDEKEKNAKKIQMVQELIEEIYAVLGVHITPGNMDTPYRVAKMWVNEVFAKHDLAELDKQMKLFPNPVPLEGTPSPVVCEMEFSSFCEHHLLPFFGKCRIEYTPTVEILGLSKFNRIVNFFSQRPQTQESLTRSICMYVKQITGGKNVRVTLYDTTHTCVECRGVRGKSNTTTEYFID